MTGLDLRAATWIEIEDGIWIVNGDGIEIGIESEIACETATWTDEMTGAWR